MVSRFPGCFPAGQPAACAGACRCPSPGARLCASLAELLGAPGLAGCEPRLMQRAAPSRDCTQEEGFGRHHREAARGSAGWEESRAAGCGGRGCGEGEASPGVMSGGAGAGPGDRPSWKPLPRDWLQRCRSGAGQHLPSGGATKLHLSHPAGPLSINIPRLLAKKPQGARIARPAALLVTLRVCLQFSCIDFIWVIGVGGPGALEGRRMAQLVARSWFGHPPRQAWGAL